MTRRYPAYRDSGVEWLGEVPDGWEVRRLKEVCRVFPSNVDKHTVEGETPVLLCNYTDVYYREVITRDLDFMRASATDEQIQKFHLKEGDVLFTKDSETADDIGISALVKETMVDVLCGYHLSIARPKPGTSGGFIKRFLDSASAKAHFAVTANGLTRVGLGQAAVGNLALPFPPISQQTAIAAFLDRETAKLDALMDEQRRLIALLREKRQAVISHAVTKGLNPAAPMKPSGVDWLGDVPEGWEVKQLKHLVAPGTSITYGIVQAGPEFEGGIPYIRTSDMSGTHLPVSGYALTSPEVEKNYLRSRVFPGDLVIAIRATIGKCLEVPEELRIANLTQGTAKFSAGDMCDRTFIRLLISATPSQAYFDLMAKGATFREITLDALRRLPVALPPLDEQKAIASYLVSRINDFDSLIDTAESAITLLQERRAALISAAVTGKIDVRDLAPARTEAA